MDESESEIQDPIVVPQNYDLPEDDFWDGN